MLNKFWQRVALISFFFPFFFVLIFLVPHQHHLLLNICAVLVSVGGAFEVLLMVRRKGIRTHSLLPVLSGLLPLAAYAEVAGFLSGGWVLAVLSGLIALALLSGIGARSQQELPDVMQRVSASILVLVYPALFITYIVRLTGLAQPSLVLLFFFSLVFSNDIMAYVAGILIGQRQRARRASRNLPTLVLAVSPNKTPIGFIAGLLSSVAVALLFRRLCPEFLTSGYAGAALIGVVVGCTTILGDLVESSLKRSVQVKDSSGVLPGRGGLMDSMDSWLISAPAFYFLLTRLLG
jgi:phosphatidate cytidylyltransferase